jgi:AcrR family transcriptional regulator
MLAQITQLSNIFGMTPKTRTYAPTERRRRQIISATIQALAESGYASLTFSRIRDVGELSSTRLISYHFDSKERLMEAVVMQVVSDAGEVMRPAMDAASDFRGKLAAYIRSNLEYLAANPASAIAVTEIVRGSGRPRDGDDVSVMLLSILLSQGQHAGEFGEFEPEVMARSIRATIDEFAYRRTLEPADATEEIDEIVAIYDRAAHRAEEGRS